jgi:hypothetical protein
MEFSDTPTFVDWRGKTFSESAREQGHYIGSTNIQAVLNYLLSMAKMFSVTPDQMINTLLVQIGLSWKNAWPIGKQRVIRRRLLSIGI